MERKADVRYAGLDIDWKSCVETPASTSSKALWRPKPMEGLTPEYMLQNCSSERPHGWSSFSPSLHTPCESTAPSESFRSSPSSARLETTPSGCNSPGSGVATPGPPVVAGASTARSIVEFHQLSPVASSECEDAVQESLGGFLLPPPAASSVSNTSNEVSPLVQFLRRAKALKLALMQTMELQQQTLQLLLLHPRVALAASDAPCCWCSSAAYPQRQQQQSCVVMLQIEMLQELLQQSSSQLQQQREDLQRGEILLCEEQQRELQHHETLSSLLPHWQQQQNQAVAAAAAELRIRRSVLNHHFQQLKEALQQQQRLQQEARARWLVEAADEIRTCYPEASDVEVLKLLEPQGAVDMWGCELSDGLIGRQLREKREKLLRLEESLRQLQRMMGLLQKQQQKRQEQQKQVADVVVHSQKLTAAACTDLLVAHKYREQRVKSIQSIMQCVCCFVSFPDPRYQVPQG